MLPLKAAGLLPEPTSCESYFKYNFLDTTLAFTKQMKLT